MKRLKINEDSGTNDLSNNHDADVTEREGNNYDKSNNDNSNSKSDASDIIKNENNVFNHDDQLLQYLEDENIKDKIIVYSDIDLDLVSKYSVIKIIRLEEFKKEFFSIKEVGARQPLLVYGEASHVFLKNFENLFQFWFKNLLTIDYDTLFSICDIKEKDNDDNDNSDIDIENKDNKFKDMLIENEIIKE